jgi:hypothetical protein
MPRNNRYHSRKFLNKKHGMAAVEIDARYTAWNFDCSVTLTDCNRRIDLDFAMWEAKAVKEKLTKLDLLISELTSLREYLGPATEEFIKLNANKNKNKNASILNVLQDNEDD